MDDWCEKHGFDGDAKTKSIYIIFVVDGMIDPCKICRNTTHNQRQTQLKELWQRITNKRSKGSTPSPPPTIPRTHAPRTHTRRGGVWEGRGTIIPILTLLFTLVLPRPHPLFHARTHHTYTRRGGVWEGRGTVIPILALLFTFKHPNRTMASHSPLTHV